MGIELPAVGPGADSDEEEDTDDRPPTTVEYLDYRAVVLNDWDVHDEDLFAKAAEAGLPEAQYGRMEVEKGETLLRSAEANDLQWAFQCRAGTCNACTGVLKRGEVEMDVNLALDDEAVEERDLFLTCTCYPESDELQVVFNAAPLAELEEPGRGREPPASGAEAEDD